MRRRASRRRASTRRSRCPRPSSPSSNAALEKRFGKKIEATVNVDPALIGGARITVGDTVIDGSVQAKLSAMANQLHA